MRWATWRFKCPSVVFSSRFRLRLFRHRNALISFTYFFLSLVLSFARLCYLFSHIFLELSAPIFVLLSASIIFLVILPDFIIAVRPNQSNYFVFISTDAGCCFVILRMSPVLLCPILSSQLSFWDVSFHCVYFSFTHISSPSSVFL